MFEIFCPIYDVLPNYDVYIGLISCIIVSAWCIGVL